MAEDVFYIRRMWSFSRALDLALIDEEVERGLQVSLGERHGERVAYIAMRLGRALGLSKKTLVHVTVAGLLHDIGALGNFTDYKGAKRILEEHCLTGAAIVKRFPDGAILAPAIKYHHETPDARQGAFGAPAEEVPLMARILSLADQIDLRLKRRLSSRREREEILEWVTQETGKLFYPEVAAAFKEVAQKEAFWLDIEQPDLLQIALGLLCGQWHLPSARELENGFTDELAATFADLIDQKSKFTARHSRSVAETVERLARGLGWQDDRLHEIYVAGLLHDLGKLSVPRKILDKPGPLDSAEIEIIRTHTYYTHRLLTEAGFPTRMVEWAAHHHERLDGRGYPFALVDKDLDEGARLMAIADIFAALTEDRPYRAAMSTGEALALIQRGAGTMLDPSLINLAKRTLGQGDRFLVPSNGIEGGEITLFEDAFYVRQMWGFSRALDLGLVDEEIERGLQFSLGERHGERVAYISMRVGRFLGIRKEALVQLTVAGLLHDIGALGCFCKYHGDPRILEKHCYTGASIVERFPAGEILAPAIKYHHETPDPRYSPLGAPADEVPLIARILSLANQIDLRLKRRLSSQRERKEIIEWVTAQTGTIFYPEVAAAFKQVAQKEAFWLDIEQSDLLQIALGLLFGQWQLPATCELDGEFTDILAATFADLIDQKSEFTAQHSRLVAEIVKRLARELGWDDHRLHEIYIAGLLHDLGKLAIPKKILDKPGPLEPDEFEIIRTHTYYTHRLLTEAGFPTRLVEWAAHHHEFLDGKGYPFALADKDLNEGARLMAIADVYAALTEDRPYRRAMSSEEALALIQRKAGTILDPDLIGLAKRLLA